MPLVQFIELTTLISGEKIMLNINDISYFEKRSEGDGTQIIMNIILKKFSTNESNTKYYTQGQLAVKESYEEVKRKIEDER